MINIDTIDNHNDLCNMTSSRVGLTEENRQNLVLSTEALADSPSEEEMKSRPNSTSEIDNLTTEMAPVLEARSINCLPNNLLQLIFSYLDVRERFKTELVCKKWRSIGKFLSWSNVVTLIFDVESADSSFGIPSSELTDNILLSLLMRFGERLATLKLNFICSENVELTCKSIENIVKNCPNLEVLQLVRIPAVDDVALNIIALSCHKLRKFDIAYFPDSESEEGILDIVRKCEALESIHISGLNLSEKLFDVASARLAEITFGKCEQVKNALQNLTANTQINLRKLTVYFLSDNLMGADESTWFAVFDRFKISLQNLTVYKFGMLPNMNWCEGLKNLHNLVELILKFFSTIHDDLITVIVNQCPKLRTLELPGSNITDSGVADLNSLPHLKELDISQNRNVSARGLSDLVERDTLKVLYVGCAPRITEEFCCSLAKKCPNLETLDLSGSKHVTNRLVAAFRDAIKSGLRQQPVTLIVGDTSVNANVKTCDGMEIDFRCSL